MSTNAPDSEGRAHLTALLRTLFASQHFATLATHHQGQPYTSLVAFAVTDNLRTVVFATMRATRKFTNLSADARVALLMDDRANEPTDLREATAVTAMGSAYEALGAERRLLEGLLLAKHPDLAEFLATPGCALLAVRVQTYTVVTSFQNVQELIP
jgi:heme iron utilization protein